MKTYIALFRGINVGGKCILLMKDLVALLEDLGARNVRTYIQSGNAIFQSAEENVSHLCNKISDAVGQRRGFRPHVLILELAELEKAIAENPFPEAESAPGTLHLGFLAYPPKKVDLEKIESLKKGSEKFHLGEHVFYLYAPEGVGRSKLAANIEKLLGVPMADRNWRTACKIKEMAAG